MGDSGTTPLPLNGDKHSGQLIIKAQLGDDIRKMMIHNEDLTLNELVLMMERVFAGKISNLDELTIKYLDDDGDKITLLNDSDLNVALHFHKLLRLFVFVNGKEPTNNSTENSNEQGNLIDTKAYRNELQDIRNSVQMILDRLQLSNNDNPTAAVASNTTREVDPLKHLNQQQQSVSPDSNRSNNEPTTETNQAPTTQFQPMPASHFTPAAYNPEQQAKTNIFGPPPSNFPGIPPLSNATTPRFPPATTPSATHASPPPPAGSFYGQQQATSPPAPGGFYAQQQAAFQPGAPVANYNPQNPFPPQAASNPSFVQQPYGAYSPPNPYFNPAQQYPK